MKQLINTTIHIIKHLKRNLFNDKDAQFKIDDIVTISKYKKNFAQGYVPNWYGEVVVIKESKDIVPLT